MPVKNISGEGLRRKSVIAKLSEKAKSFTEYFDAAEPTLKTIEEYSQIAGDLPFLSVLKVFSKLLSEVTKISDPEELGYHACKIAFLDALQMALNAEDFISAAEPSKAVSEVEKQLREISLENVDFTTFKLSEANTHKYFNLAEEHADARLAILGFSELQRNEIRLKIKDNFEECLRKLFTKKETAEQFGRFKDYIELDQTNKIARQNLNRHSKYQIWQYTSAPVLGREPFSLKHVFVEPECGMLKWNQIHPDEEAPGRKTEEGNKRERQNPFDEKCGGRHKMLELVMKLIADKTETEPIIIQGYAGSGKTSFTLRLCEELVEKGLTPIRVRLRDINLSKEIEESLPQAVRLSNKEYVNKNPLISNKILEEKGIGDFSEVSRYVLILDGWDEITVSANEGFRARVEKMLEQIKNSYIKYANTPVKIILTGRPSADVTDNTFLKENTTILTIRDSRPEQFEEFVDKITAAVKPDKIAAFQEKLKEAPPEYLSDIVKAGEMPLDIEDWTQLTKNKFNKILQTFRESPQQIEVLGLPLLAHLASRLIAVWKDDALDLIHDKTLLYRNLINMTCEKAGKASIDARDTKSDISDQPRFIGEKLRKLLWGTASAMSLFSEDSISYDELEKRLESEDELKNIVEEISEKNWLSSLLISFYFKGGAKDLGCEFSHKSFREYLFAESIVEVLKDYGRNVKNNLPERENFWEDFPERDSRHDLSRRLSKLFASQQLRTEVYFYLQNLLEWEIKRALDKTAVKDVGLQTQELNLEGWRKIRDGLTDVWDWWMTKTHLRLQPEVDRRGNREFSIAPFVYELINHNLPKTEDQIPQTADVINRNLGINFFVLICLVYEYLRNTDELAKTAELGKYQSIIDNKIAFCPFLHRKPDNVSKNEINIQDFKLWLNANLGILNFSEVPISNILFADCYLQSSIFSKSRLGNLTFFDANVSIGQFNDTFINFLDSFGSDLSYANFENARILKSIFEITNLSSASFLNGELNQCDLSESNLNKTNFAKAKFVLCNFSGCDCIETNFDDAVLQNCKFVDTNFLNTDLSKTSGLTLEQLEEALIGENTKFPKDLEAHKGHLIQLTRERMEAIEHETDAVEEDDF